ncbi:Protein CBG02041 [Caenorhabditis briggsae]|uniref:Protein CBG02041 n=1 Tax=Caenorhabditis briggsae TaxID=6238 RepID=A8WRV6_CAEBR|nr:Protein CBG02041 [Caenorhabditis briggsae]CAP23214.2 Protein CBG02041 [Caenorhabditis briggsae]
MTEPVISCMKNFVVSEIAKITAEHEQMISGWKHVNLTEENIRHLYDLLKNCSKQEIQLFEQNNFLKGAKNYELITRKLIPEEKTKDVTKNAKKGSKKKSGKKKGKSANQSDNNNVSRNPPKELTETEIQKIDKKSETTSPKSQFASSHQDIEIPISSSSKSDLSQNDSVQNKEESLDSKPTAPDTEEPDVVTVKPANKPTKPESEIMATVTKTAEAQAITQEATTATKSSEPQSEGSATVTQTADSGEQSKNPDNAVFKTPHLPKRLLTSEKFDEDEKMDQIAKAVDQAFEGGDVATIAEKAPPSPTPSPTETSDEPKKKAKNPFDNEHLFIEPLCTANTKNLETTTATDIMPLGNHYMSPESNALKSNLQKLATDISTEEQQIRARLESGEPADTDDAALEDFIARANTVLKETEAVTVRKIAEAETRKFLSALRVPIGDSFETISKDLVQDIWPKTNKWRSFARKNSGCPPLDEINLKEKRKKEEQVERDVRSAIKAAGEPLNKKQIGQIRKAAITYRDFDLKEQQELDFRSNHISKLVELVSAYEDSNKMDELICMRLAIAFCTKRRDYFLKIKPPNFMQFSYMYIFLLEKINLKTASICACLNYQSTVSSDFDELEELMLNLFHEDYFLNMI